MAQTSAERTAIVHPENRSVFVDTGVNTFGRRVRVPQENRLVFVPPQATSAARTVLVGED